MHGWLQTDREREALETLIPQLAESEDERIRKEIIDIVEAYRANCVYEGTHRFDDCLAYLEKQKEQKPAEWSEEDERMLSRCIKSIECSKMFAETKAFKEAKDKEIDWLKSLRPQYHGDVTMTEAYKMGLEARKASSWKPSEEQMEYLNDAIDNYRKEDNDEAVDVLKELRKELKKLM